MQAVHELALERLNAQLDETSKTLAALEQEHAERVAALAAAEQRVSELADEVGSLTAQLGEFCWVCLLGLVRRRCGDEWPACLGARGDACASGHGFASPFSPRGTRPTEEAQACTEAATANVRYLEEQMEASAAAAAVAAEAAARDLAASESALSAARQELQTAREEAEAAAAAAAATHAQELATTATTHEEVPAGPAGC